MMIRRTTNQIITDAAKYPKQQHQQQQERQLPSFMTIMSSPKPMLRKRWDYAMIATTTPTTSSSITNLMKYDDTTISKRLWTVSSSKPHLLLSHHERSSSRRVGHRPNMFHESRNDRSLTMMKEKSTAASNDEQQHHKYHHQQPPQPSLSSTAIMKPCFHLYYNDVYQVTLPPHHRFPMKKYELVRKRKQIMEQNRKQIPQQQQQQMSSHQIRLLDCQFHVSPLATIEQLETTHCPNYIQRFMMGDMTVSEIRNIGFPWSRQGVERSLSSVGGTVAAAITICQQWERILQIKQQQQQQKDSHMDTMDYVMMPPWSGHIAGGTHHAFYNYGEGFCIFNDIAVAVNVILSQYSHMIQNVLIIDLDVHQGNGSASLFHDHPNVFTFSIHCIGNYFSKKQQSHLDIELPIGCTDDTYIPTLYHWLNQFRHMKTKNRHPHDENYFDIIFFQAGVDIIESDRLGKFHISSEGIKRRNELVYQFAYEQQIPLVITMGGGYPNRDDNWEPIVAAHTNVFVQAYNFLDNQLRYDNKKRKQKIEDNKMRK